MRTYASTNDQWARPAWSVRQKLNRVSSVQFSYVALVGQLLLAVASHVAYRLAYHQSNYHNTSVIDHR